MLDDLPRAQDDPGLAFVQRAANRTVPPSDTVLAEFSSFFGAWGVEGHPPLTDFEIPYPGDAVVRPKDKIVILMT